MLWLSSTHVILILDLRRRTSSNNYSITYYYPREHWHLLPKKYPWPLQCLVFHASCIGVAIMQDWTHRASFFPHKRSVSSLLAYLKLTISGTAIDVWCTWTGKVYIRSSVCVCVLKFFKEKHKYATWRWMIYLRDIRNLFDSIGY